MPWQWPSALAGSEVVEGLSQPINPGWSFGNVIVNSSNSTAPEVEQTVTSHFSYGKQIGRMMDALEVIVKAMPSIHGDHAVKDLLELAKEVKKEKEKSNANRLLRLRIELTTLKKRDEAAWRRLIQSQKV